MRLLAFDCAGDRRSAALLVGDALIAVASADGAARHAEELVPLVDRLVAAAGQRFRDLDLLAVGTGPGSFTGVRIAVAAGRALALALDRPAIGIDGRDVLLATPAAAGATAVAAIDARRGGLYAAWAGAENGRTETAITPEALAALLEGDLDARGSGAGLLAAAAGRRTRVDPRLPDAGDLGRTALAALRRGEQPGPGAALRPCYLRAVDAQARVI